MSTVFTPFQITKWACYWGRPYILRLSFYSIQVKITGLGVVRTTTRGTKRRFKGFASSGTTDSFATKHILWGVVRVTTSNIAGLVGVGENKVKEFYTDNRRICCCLICFCSLVTITAVDQIALVQRDRRLHLQMQFRKSFLLKWQGGDASTDKLVAHQLSAILHHREEKENIFWSKMSLKSIFIFKKFQYFFFHGKTHSAVFNVHTSHQHQQKHWPMSNFLPQLLYIFQQLSCIEPFLREIHPYNPSVSIPIKDNWDGLFIFSNVNAPLETLWNTHLHFICS